MKIYTKTGDKGETGIIGGRIPKDSPIIDAIGNLDELNASLGIVISITKAENRNPKSEIKNEESRMKNVGSPPEFSVQSLELIQNILFEIGAIIAGGKSNIDLEQSTKELEIKIDETEKKLPKLTRFILPGGSLLSSYIHMARSICRRVERSLVKMKNDPSRHSPLANPQGDKKNVRLATSDQRLESLIKFINRLSDYLFVLARFTNKEEGKKEIFWEKQ